MDEITSASLKAMEAEYFERCKIERNRYLDKLFNEAFEKLKDSIERDPLPPLHYYTKATFNYADTDKILYKINMNKEEKEMSNSNVNVEINKTPAEEWTWIEGYKGTNRDMKCKDYQFELRRVHSMPEDAEIEECRSGFHLCLKLEDVFNYYDVEDGNRFFKVRALVRVSELEKYGHDEMWSLAGKKNKLTSKSIEFLRELTADEIVAHIEGSEDWTPSEKLLCIDKGKRAVKEAHEFRTLVDLGYSGAFAQYIVEEKMFDVAKAVGSQKELSMDMKALMILRNDSGSFMSKRFLTQMANATYGLTSAANSASSSLDTLGRMTRKFR